MLNNDVAGSIIQDSVGVCFATKCRGFDEARNKYSNDMVDGVIAVLRILPVFLLIIFYWAIYSQVSIAYFYHILTLMSECKDKFKITLTSKKISCFLKIKTIE